MTEQDWKDFQRRAQLYFSKLWNVDLEERKVMVAGEVAWKFDLVSPDRRLVGDAKFLKNIPVPAAKWQGIAECIWLLQKVQANKVFMVFGKDREVAVRYLKRVYPITRPVEFYYLDDSGHKELKPPFR